ncbi:MAG: TetR/AcrR family transcriptional regulator [Treponemataceae bacterium]
MARLTNLTERGHETQRHLRDVLMNLIREKGYERVSIKDITERAGIDRTTFYLHFKDKDDLFEKSRQGIIDELIEFRSRETGPFPGVSLTFKHMAANADLYLALFRAEGIATESLALQEYIARSLVPILEPLLRERGIGSAVGTEHAGREPLAEPLARYLTGALCGLSRWWLEAGMPKSPEQMSELFLTLATHGIESLKAAP